MRACVRACVRACERPCVRACVRVQINNDELFFNALLFENSYYFSSGWALDVVRSTGNLSRCNKTLGFSCSVSIGQMPDSLAFPERLFSLRSSLPMSKLHNHLLFGLPILFFPRCHFFYHRRPCYIILFSFHHMLKSLHPHLLNFLLRFTFIVHLKKTLFFRFLLCHASSLCTAIVA